MITLDINTKQQNEFVDITTNIQLSLSKQNFINGALLILVPHTTAGITINEDADPCVVSDILKSLDKLAPFKDKYSHMEGNSAAHIKTSLMGSSVMVPVEDGRLILGRWQGIYFCEFDGPRHRNVFIQLVS